jgi:phosphoribosylaminoimidazole carboxylase PurE protein
MGSTSDWETMKAAAKTLDEFGVPYEAKAMSAHRTPELVAEWASGAAKRGVKAIIAGAGGAAHLAGVVAAHTTLPVLGVPMPSKHLQGLDSLLSTVQMPKGIPVATFAIGEASAAGKPKQSRKPSYPSHERRDPQGRGDSPRRRSRRVPHRDGLRPWRGCVKRKSRRTSLRDQGQAFGSSGHRSFRLCRARLHLGARYTRGGAKAGAAFLAWTAHPDSQALGARP